MQKCLTLFPNLLFLAPLRFPTGSFGYYLLVACVSLKLHKYVPPKATVFASFPSSRPFPSPALLQRVLSFFKCTFPALLQRFLRIVLVAETASYSVVIALFIALMSTTCESPPARSFQPLKAEAMAPVLPYLIPALSALAGDDSLQKDTPATPPVLSKSSKPHSNAP